VAGALQRALTAGDELDRGVHYQGISERLES
jgi:hypothetical protein